MTASRGKIPLWNREQLWRHLWAEQSPKRTIAHTSVEIKQAMDKCELRAHIL